MNGTRNVVSIIALTLIGIGGFSCGTRLSSHAIELEAAVYAPANTVNSAMTRQTTVDSTLNMTTQTLDNGDVVVMIQDDAGKVLMMADIATPGLSNLVDDFMASLSSVSVQSDITVHLLPSPAALPGDAAVTTKTKDAWMDETANVIYAFASSDMGALAQFIEQL